MSTATTTSHDTGQQTSPRGLQREALQPVTQQGTQRRQQAPGPILKILTYLRKPLEPPPVSPARGPPTDWGELVQIHDDRDVFQASPDDLPVIDIHSL